MPAAFGQVMRRLRWALLAAALGTAIVWIAVPDPAGKTGEPGDGAHAVVSARVAGLPVRPTFRKAAADPFAPPAWSMRSGPAVRAARAPGAPPLPFRFVGRVYQDSGTRLYLARGSKIVPVVAGDVLDGEYRVVAVSDTTVTFVHIPSGQRQVMALTTPLQEAARVPQLAPLNRSASLMLGRTSQAGAEVPE